MCSVHRILVLLALVSVGPGCVYPPPPEPIPELPAAAPGVSQPEPMLPRGYVGDPDDHVFHRLGCRLAEGIDPRYQEYFVTPYDAVNARFSPCGECRPMDGWE